MLPVSCVVYHGMLCERRTLARGRCGYRLVFVRCLVGVCERLVWGGPSLLEGQTMFQPGQSGNPRGRKKGSCGGRAQALASLDRILAKSKNKAKLEKALEKELSDNPLRFFKNIIMPLLPKESKLSVGQDGIVEWKSLLGDEPGEKPRFDEQGLPTGDL